MAGWLMVGYVLLGSAVGTVLSIAAVRVYASERQSWLSGRTASAVATAALFAELAWCFGARAELVPYGILAAVCVPLAAVDLAEMRLPSSLVLPLYPILVSLFGAIAAIRHDAAGFLRAAGGCIAMGCFLLVLAVAYRGQLGAGDVKLGGVLGFAVGWVSWPAVWATAFLSAGLALLVQVSLRARRDRGDLAFGPFLIVGMFIALALASK
ncbi:prepilin peptidase [Amycolatopsis sp. NPDC059657]|uniref:prepilin peptidase n=1 Tax=Amycolatopsis sp. NPDC059657 TaxID=3346899 RepID=UPI00366AA472